MYEKPHRSYEQQLDLLCDRGLECLDRDHALALLRAVGYYRLSAYVYPFRQLLSPDRQCQDSPVHFRSSQLLRGTTLNGVESLWRFDRRLRMRILDGLETVEIGLRTQVAHVLGRRDAFGQVTRSALDEEACSKRRSGSNLDAFGDWISRYDKLAEDARNEDFVRHHGAKYGMPLPVWVAVEFLDFGAIVRLYGLMDRQDQNEVARELGVSGGRLLAKWLKGLNYLRNVCAHHNRLWNRTVTYKIATFNPGQAGPELSHVATAPERDKVYISLAVTGYLVKKIDPQSRWGINLRDDVKKFPSLAAMSPETDMQFPVGWQDLELWQVPNVK